MIQVKEISKSFGDVKALTNISFSVNKGEVVGLLGPNGAGKTTTMRIMAGFISPDTGDVIIDDYSVSQNTIEAKNLIGYLPENNPLYKEMLVKDFLNYSADLKNLTEEEKQEAFDFVVPSVGIADVFYRPIQELSKGYKQRVGLAAALLHKPKILILDEPSEGLDPNQRAEIRRLVKELAKDHTVIISTHVMQEVEAMCSRMVIINKGEIVADGSVKELSSGLKSEKTIELDIEGKAVKTAIKGLKVRDFTVLEEKGNLIKVKFVVDAKVEIYKKISELAKKHNWIILRLEESKQQLEDVFQSLTNNGASGAASGTAKGKDL